MTVTPVGMRCPDCARDRTRTRTAASVGVGEEPVLTYVLIGINVAVALGGFLSGASATGGGTGGSSLIADGAGARFHSAQGDSWRLGTSGFLPSGCVHLLCHLFALSILGAFLVLYVAFTASPVPPTGREAPDRCCG